MSFLHKPRFTLSTLALVLAALASPPLSTSEDRPVTRAEINELDGGGLSLLHHFAMQGSAANVQALLDQGAHPDVYSTQGMTALHYAAYSGDVESVAALLRAGAEVDAHDGNEWTPLYWAATNGHVNAVRHLVAAGASLDGAAPEGENLVVAAIVGGEVDAVRVLRELGATYDPNRRLGSGRAQLHVSAMSGKLTEVQGLIAAGADVNLREDTEARTTALHFAAGLGHLEVVAELLAAGAEIDAEDSVGFTPLMEAALRGEIEAVQALLDAGSESIGSALYVAQESGHERVARVLANATRPSAGGSSRDDSSGREGGGARLGDRTEGAAGAISAAEDGSGSVSVSDSVRGTDDPGDPPEEIRGDIVRVEAPADDGLFRFRPGDTLDHELASGEAEDYELWVDTAVVAYFDIVEASNLARYTLFDESGGEILDSGGSDAGPLTLPAGRHRFRVENPGDRRLWFRVRFIERR
jgi:ankyrin repeat protein